MANDPFPAETHEDALDKLNMQTQELQEELDRSLKNVIIIPIPVAPKSKPIKYWWKIDNFYLLVVEYLKFTLKKLYISF